MNKTLEVALSKQFEIAHSLSLQPVARGFLSRNFVVQADTDKYFLKQYRFTQLESVLAVHEAKFFFAAAGIPVILPLRTRQGEYFFEFGGRYWSLFPYVDGKHLQRGSFLTQAIESSAELLSRIHRSGKGATVSYVKPKPLVRDTTLFDKTTEELLSRIGKSSMTEFDRLALETVKLKMALAKRHRQDFVKIDLPSNHLVHGDYQDANLFFDAEARVSHVFDWELTRIIPRGFELVRAIEFICFANPENFKAVFSAENYDKARCFLQHYHYFYPIERAEFEVVWRARYFDKVLSLWVEEDHYLHDNPRVDPFLESEYHAVHYYSDHLSEHIEALSEGILK